MTKPGTIAGAQDRERQSFGDASRGNVSWFTLFSSEMTPTSAMSAGIMEIEPNGGLLKPHRHSQAELYYAVEGSGTLTIEGVARPLSTGLAAFIPGDAEHSLRKDGEAVLRIFYVFPTDSFSEIVYRFPPRDGSSGADY